MAIVYLLMSQSPEGSTANCDVSAVPKADELNDEDVSIPRRVDGQLRQKQSESPKRTLGVCLNPPKGRRPIATFYEVDDVRATDDVSIPRRVDGQLRRLSG